MVKLGIVATMGRLVDSLSSYDTNVMLAAIISLLVVILFVLLLHLFAKWFLSQAPHGRVPPTPFLASSRHLNPSGQHHSFSPTSAKGLDSAAIASIPLFVYRMRELQYKQMEECVICLSALEENEVCRCLSRCRHVFHVQCIDKWLGTHSDCPICRAPVTGNRFDRESVDRTAETTAAVEPVLETVILVFEHANADGRLPGDANSSSSEETRSSTSSSPSSSSNSLRCSLKRMLSRNRSENKIFPSPSSETE